MQAPQEDIARYNHIPEKKRRVYAAMVDVMDRGIGEVITALETHDLRDNTLIFILSDNGSPQAEKSNPGKWNGSSNQPFRGGKGNLYDGGVHVPFIASWPAKIRAGQTFDAPVISRDISRTAVAVAGADATAAPAMEGVDLIPFVTGQQDGVPHEAIFWRGGDGKQWSVLAADGTKYLNDKGNSAPEMFYLPDDMGESQDILSSHPERAMQLQETWSAWNQQNVPCRLEGYINYHKIRDKFFSQAIPEAAKESGYAPEVNGNFK